MSRGCTVHAAALGLELRSLPVPREARQTFDIPLGPGYLYPSLGSATRRSGAYRDGTSTRKLDMPWRQNPVGMQSAPWDRDPRSAALGSVDDVGLERVGTNQTAVFLRE